MYPEKEICNYRNDELKECSLYESETETCHEIFFKKLKKKRKKRWGLLGGSVGQASDS